MDKKIYSLPEEWFNDPNVSNKWKIYAIINGFWINKLPVYVSNNYFEEKLKISKSAVQQSILELEKIGLVTRQIHGMERYLLPGGTKPSLVGVPSPAAMGYQAQLGHIASSIAPSISSVVNTTHNAFRIVKEVEEERPHRTKAQKQFPHSVEVFELWGRFPANWRLNRTQLQAADNLFQEHGLDQIRKALAFLKENKDHTYCPQVLTPYDLDSKWKNIFAFKRKYDL